MDRHQPASAPCGGAGGLVAFICLSVGLVILIGFIWAAVLLATAAVAGVLVVAIGCRHAWRYAPLVGRSGVRTWGLLRQRLHRC